MKGRTRFEPKESGASGLSLPTFVPASENFESSIPSAAPNVGHCFSKLSEVQPLTELTASQAVDHDGRTDWHEGTPCNTQVEATSLNLQISGMRAGGQPLPPAVCGFFELRLGHDFSRVRVHTDASAEESASSLNARAYTAGQDIVFRESEYDPHSARGQQLLAHELAHVVQIDRAGIRPDPSYITPRNHASEVEARAASQPGAMPVLSAAPVGLALDDGAMVMPPVEIKGQDPNVVVCWVALSRVVRSPTRRHKK